MSINLPFSNDSVLSIGRFLLILHGVTADPIICHLRKPATCEIKQHWNSSDSTQTIQFNQSAIISKFALNDDYQHRLDAIPYAIFTAFPLVNNLQLNHAQIRSLEISGVNTSVPSFVSNLTSLALQENNLTLIDVHAFPWAPNLTNLDLSINHIEDVASHALRGLDKLKSLKLNNNRIAHLRSNALTDAIALEYLHLHSNGMTNIDEHALDFPELIELILRDNQLTMLPDNAFAQSANTIEFVDIAANRLRNIGQMFYHCKKLHFLTLDENPINDVDLCAFANMPSLSMLSLSNTNFIMPSEQNDSICRQSTLTSKLSRLSLDNNSLSNPDLFNQLTIFPNLQILFLNANQFKNFSHTAQQLKSMLPKLRVINLIDNNLICQWFWLNKESFRMFGIHLVVKCAY